MIQIESKNGDMFLHVEEEGGDLADELSGIIAVFMEHCPDVLAQALRKMDEYEMYIEVQNDKSLDELFGECLKELDLLMKVRGKNNAKS